MAKKRSNAATQTRVYVAKNFRLFLNQKDWKFIIIAGVIAVLVSSIVGDKMFENFESTKSGFFALVSAGIWIGIFNSIQRICKEHDTITSEYRSGLHISSYIMSHVIFDFFLCLSQSMLLFFISKIFIDYPSRGLIFRYAVIEYAITFFLIVWGSDIMGIMVSSISPNPNTAMTAMPFVLIIQLVMSGVLFELSGWSEKIADITVSKWGMSALGSIADLNSEELPLRMNEAFPNVVRLEDDAMFTHTSEHLLTSWIVILVIMFVCTLVSIIALKIKNRGS
ncbi:MAG: ABC transporter permease [Clostridiales bacterium]|nr:ABC transporter permease [Clostridiales bacterium]